MRGTQNRRTRGRRRRRITAAALSSAALAATLALPVPGAHAQQRSVAGTCSITGTATYGNPVTNVPRDNTYVFDGDGRCNGSVDGQAVSQIPVKFRVSGPFTGSCGDARSTAPGQGTLHWARGNNDPRDDVDILFSMEFVASGTDVTLSVTGERAGSARGRATFATGRTPTDVAVRCATTGVKELPFDGSVSTDAPLTSGNPFLDATLNVVRESLPTVAERGLATRVVSTETATAALSATVSRTTARRLGLRSTRIGSVRGVVAGGSTESLTLRLGSSARKGLSRARSVTVIVSGKVVNSTGVRRLRRTVTLTR